MILNPYFGRYNPSSYYPKGYFFDRAEAPIPIVPDEGGSSGGRGEKYYRKRLEPKRFSEAKDEEDLELILAVWLNIK